MSEAQSGAWRTRRNGPGDLRHAAHRLCSGLRRALADAALRCHQGEAADFANPLHGGRTLADLCRELLSRPFVRGRAHCDASDN